MAVDLDLTIQRAAGQSYQADLRVHIAGSAAPIAPLPAPITIAFDLAHLRVLTLDPRAYGATLSTMLFATAELRAAFAQARAVAAQHATPLRLRLAIVPEAEELHALRWETLADPETPDQMLAVSTQILFSRTLPSPDWKPIPLRAGEALRAVALVAAPTDLSDYSLAAVDATQEVARVRAHLNDCELVVLSQETRASLPNLLQHLHRGCDLLFMLAHGRIDESGQTWLYLEDTAGHTAPVAGTELVTRIATLANKPRLVILGCCESAGDGSDAALTALGPQLVRAGMQAVLAMQGRVTLETLRLFLPTCLQALMEDGRIDRAVAIARDQVRERPDWWVPALWMRATDGRLWTEPARSSTPPNTALHQLRPPIADFVGRQEEIARLTAVLRQTQTKEAHIAAICGVRGMGGIGKTTLAEHVAHQLRPLFPDAQMVIDLRGASAEPLAPAQALQQLVRAFVPEEKLPDDLLALQARYRSLLDGRRALILADDARDAAQVRPLLPPVGCALLITSRQRFTLDGMAVLDLARLGEAEAIQLLQSICPRLTKDQAKHITHLCGGLPLALRVSAGILLNDEGLPVERYLTQLADERRRLTQLRDPDDPERDVAATLGLSYAALDQKTQALFRRLGVLAADAELSLIAAVLEQREEDAEMVLRLLLRRSLVEYDSARERWGLHDLVRMFALDLLVVSGEEQKVRLCYAEQITQMMQQINECHYRSNSEISTGLTRFDEEITHINTVRSWLQIQQPDTKIESLIINEALSTGKIGLIRDPLHDVYIPYQRYALEIARRQGDLHSQGQLLCNIGAAFFVLSEIHTAIGYYEQSLVISHKLGNQKSECYTLNNLGASYYRLGETSRAINYHTQALTISRKTGDQINEGKALINLGNAYADLGDISIAINHYKQSLAVMHEIGDHQETGIILNNLGLSYSDSGDGHSAIRHLNQALTIAREIRDDRLEGHILDNLGTAHYLQSNFTEALVSYKATHVLAQKFGDRLLEGMALRGLANTQVILKQHTEAITNYETSLVILKTIENSAELARTRWAYGQFLLHQGEHERGLALMQECLAYEQRIGHAQTAEHAALIAHLHAGGAPPFPVPYVAFAPLRHAIVAVAQGEEYLRAEAEAALMQWERRFYHLTAPIKAIWAGQRDPDALTEGLSTTDAALVRQVLSDLGVDCWGELVAPAATSATIAA